MRLEFYVRCTPSGGDGMQCFVEMTGGSRIAFLEGYGQERDFFTKPRRRIILTGLPSSWCLLGSFII